MTQKSLLLTRHISLGLRPEINRIHTLDIFGLYAYSKISCRPDNNYDLNSSDFPNSSSERIQEAIKRMAPNPLRKILRMARIIPPKPPEL